MLYHLSLFFILYLPIQVALNPIEGIDLASTRLLAIFIFLLWIVQSLKKKRLYLPNRIQTILLLSFIFLSGFSIFFVESPIWFGKKMFFLLSFFPLYFVFADLAQDPKRYQRLVRFLIYGGALTALIALIQFSLQFIIGLDEALDLWRKIMPLFLGQTFSQSVLEYPSWLVNVGGKTIFRSISFFPDPHMLSLFLGLIFPWSFILALQEAKANARKGLFFGGIALLIILADLFTFSRGGYLGLIGGILFSAYWMIKKYRQKYVLPFLILFFLLSLAWFVPNPLTQRLATSLNPAEGSNQERLKNWQDALIIIQTNPLVGSGLGNYSLAVKPTVKYRDPIYAHNLYLDITAETGILNGIIFMMLIFSAIRSFLQKAKDAIFYLGGALGLIVFSVHSIFETGLYSVQVLPLLVIILALSNTTQKDDPKNT